MKPLVVILLLAISVQAQSLADVARKERERQAKSSPTLVITSSDSGKTPAENAKPDETPQDTKGEAAAAEPAQPDKTGEPAPSKELPKPQAPPPVDPVKIWNEQADLLRARIRNLQDQETALQLQVGQISNQIYAPITDPDTQSRAQTQLGQTQQLLAKVRSDLDQAKKTLDAMQLAGPPKK